MKTNLRPVNYQMSWNLSWMFLPPFTVIFYNKWISNSNIVFYLLISNKEKQHFPAHMWAKLLSYFDVLILINIYVRLFDVKCILCVLYAFIAKKWHSLEITMGRNLDLRCIRWRLTQASTHRIQVEGSAISGVQQPLFHSFAIRHACVVFKTLNTCC